MLPGIRLLIGLLPVVAAAQSFYNLDFELATRGRLRNWPFGSAGFALATDTNEFVSGAQSARIRNTGAPDTGLGVTSQLLPIDLVRGKKVKFSGYMKTDAVTPGYAALWLRVDGPNGAISLDNMSQTGPRGTTGWTRYEYEREISQQGTVVIFGFFLGGRGTAWFDDLRIEVDGVPLTEVPPFAGEPSESQLEWLSANSVPFASPDAGGGFDDLQPLKQIIGNARIVGVGEATHGTSEFFRMKHRLLEFLATEMGFTIFAIEANMPEAYRLNDYVLTGRGDPKELLKGMYFWTWNTQEVLEMITWMRGFNESGRGRVQFTGFDMQTWTVAGQIVRSFVQQADAAYLTELDAAYQLVRDTRTLPVNALNTPRLIAAAEAAEKIRKDLESRAEDYGGKFPRADVDWAVQNARVVEQAAWLTLRGSLYRDEVMALNTRWILDQNPDAKMFIWAHNYHVSRVPGAQGSYLARQYGNDYTVLGFAFHEGRFNALAVQPSGAFGPLQANDAAQSFPGSVEYVFHRTGIPQFVLDLRLASADNPGAWLLGEMEFREIGSVAVDGFTIRRTLANDYDALIFFEQSTPSALLPF